MHSIIILLLLPSLWMPIAQSTREGVGVVSMPTIAGETGMVAIQAGEPLPVTWLDPPPDALLYVFAWLPLADGQPPLLLGIDTDVADGISLLWTPPEYLYGRPFALAVYPDGHILTSSLTCLEYGSGKAPPPGICSVVGIGNSGSPEVFDYPPNSGTYQVLGYLNDYAPVLEQLDDTEGFRWWKIDLAQQDAVAKIADVALPDTGWIYAVGASLHGDCSFLEK